MQKNYLLLLAGRYEKIARAHCIGLSQYYRRWWLAVAKWNERLNRELI
jgi:hypothetical protein